MAGKSGRFDKEREARLNQRMATNFIKRKVGLSLGLLCLSMARVFAADPLPSVDLQVAYPELSLNRPLWMEESPDGTKRIFVVEQDGRILILPNDRQGRETKTFLDISDRHPHQQNEEGLLGMAFHPQYKANHKFYIYYSQQEPKRNVVSEFQASASDPDKADLSSERILLEIQRPYWNHDGGCMVSGPDGYLYFSVGDGGDANDPHSVGQSLNFWQAKILRIDVNARDVRSRYGIPKDNPFVGGYHDEAGHRPEIWALGLRNVWRMSFDRETGQLWAADVGQDKWEEVDLIVKGGNYGWSVREGFHDFKNQKAQGKLLDPVIEYPHNPGLSGECKFPDHSPGVSITGGYVYRGKKIPALRGAYVYGDFAMGTVWGLRYENGAVTAHARLVKENPTRQIASFAEDKDGELYVLAFDGKIYQLTETALR